MLLHNDRRTPYLDLSRAGPAAPHRTGPPHTPVRPVSYDARMAMVTCPPCGGREERTERLRHESCSEVRHSARRRGSIAPMDVHRCLGWLLLIVLAGSCGSSAQKASTSSATKMTTTT